MASRVLNDFKWALSRVVPCLHVVHLKSVSVLKFQVVLDCVCYILKNL